MNKKNLKNLELIKKINKDFLIYQKSAIFICLILLLIVSLTTAIYPFLIQKVFDNFTENKYPWFFSSDYNCSCCIYKRCSNVFSNKTSIKSNIKS